MANVYSAIKVFHHKDALDAIERGEVCAPFYIRLKPTNLCNHHCVYCTYGSGNTENKTLNRDGVNHADSIPWTKMQEIIRDMGDMGVKAVTLSGGGEPLTYPHVVDALRMFRDRGVDLSIISNGQLLAGDVAEQLYDAKWVRISFDSPNEEEYLKLRGLHGDEFQRVISNIKNFASKKSADCVLGVNYVISRANFHRVYEAAKLLKELGVNNVKFAAVIENTPGYHKGIKDEVIRQIHQADEDLSDNVFQVINNYESEWTDKQFTRQPFKTCYTCRLVTVIAADQKVYLCHTRAYDSSAIVGDLREKGFKELWFSEETKRRLMELQPERDCKNFCAYESRNCLIESYFNVDYNHINFI